MQRHWISLGLALAVAWLLVAAPASADVIHVLLDHGDGGQGTNYGLRIDDNGVNTFSFEQGGAHVTMTFFTDGSNTALIEGIIRHNQSSEL